MQLPEFCLDFGYVVCGSMIPIQPLILTNNGHTPISFAIPHATLEGSGFSVDIMEKVCSLPPGEWLEFNVTFDPTAIRILDGEVVKDLHFNVSHAFPVTPARMSHACHMQLAGGPQYTVRLRAYVTRPKLDVSSTNLDFGIVVCGQCKIITIRLKNTHTVR